MVAEFFWRHTRVLRESQVEGLSVGKPYHGSHVLHLKRRAARVGEYANSSLDAIAVYHLRVVAMAMCADGGAEVAHVCAYLVHQGAGAIGGIEVSFFHDHFLFHLLIYVVQ